MTIKETIAHLKKSPLDAWYYIQGSWRLQVYNSKRWRWLLRKHIVGTYELRKDVWAKPCAINGECLCCGCSTPAVFFADKECSVPKYKACSAMGMTRCYGPMPSRKEWNKFKTQIS